MCLAKVIEARTVSINYTSLTGRFNLPFRGYKSSGIGREAIHHSLNNYLKTKTVLLKLEKYKLDHIYR